MREIDILTKISSMKIDNLMRHEQFADVMDFLGLKGFKREGEYHYLAENIEFRKLHRYAINHLNEMIFDEIFQNPKLQPSSWKGHNRSEIEPSTRKRYIRQMFIDWRSWEKESHKKLMGYYQEMENLNCVVAAYILCMLEENLKEIKYLERQILEYESVDWDMVYIMSKQEELHECYKEKSNQLKI